MQKGLSLTQLAAKIEGLKELKQDYISDTRKLELSAATDGVVSLVGEDVGKLNVKAAFPIRPLAHDQIGGRVNIPAKYYDRMLQDAPDLLCKNVNHWFHSKPERRMLRTLGGDLRAFLSDRYQRIENEEVAGVALPVLFNMGEQHGMNVVSCEVTETRLYIQATTTRLTKEVKKGDVVQAGVIIRNSEVGCGAVSVQPLIYRLVCLNGMVMPDGRFSRYHIGARQESTEMLWADDTKALQDKTKLLEIRDAIKAAVDETTFSQRVDKMTALTTQPITGDVPKVIEALSKKIGSSEAENSGFLKALITGGDLSAWGVVNAVTHMAHEVKDYDRSVQLEAAGGQLVDLSPSEWKQVLEAA